MLLIASRRKLGNKRRDKREMSEHTHYLGVSRHTRSNSTDLITDMRQATWLSHAKAAGAAHGVVIYIHGFNTPQGTMLKRHYLLKHHLRSNGFKGVVIAFDWPNWGKAYQYSYDLDRALEAAPAVLSDIVAPLRAKVPSPDIHIVAHSMGALVTSYVLKDLTAGAAAGLGGFLFDQVCFVSADVHAKNFAPDQPDWTNLTEGCRRFTNYCSATDKVLKVPGPLVSGLQKRLGQAGLPRAGKGETYDVEGQNRFAQFKKRNGARHSHTWWFEDALFLNDLAKTLRGDGPGNVSTRLSAHKPPQQILNPLP